MSQSSEVIRIVQFVRNQRARVQSERQWKHRLAQFGFAINETHDGPAILTLPAKRMVCLLPADLRA